MVTKNGNEQRNHISGKPIDGTKVTIHYVPINDLGETASFYGRVWRFSIKGNTVKMTITLFKRDDGISVTNSYKDESVSVYSEGNRTFVEFTGLSSDFFKCCIRVRTGTGCKNCGGQNKCDYHHLWSKTIDEDFLHSLSEE